ncbi:hypothetical protein SAMN02745673_02869 [Marinactinospora thermotolerans DSM 45154]|uniref:Uncharacterized protein n=1 Tax=Marinactinospora thermotolerans DSM 45154 TaxID=1122192 RepID=A0A1T4RQ39_9ACTN|nr:hypothetical protein SAMN02745673_02869 [Marinactinospora thermotolerans DSM 45154]
MSPIEIVAGPHATRPAHASGMSRGRRRADENRRAPRPQDRVSARPRATRFPDPWTDNGAVPLAPHFTPLEKTP